MENGGYAEKSKKAPPPGAALWNRLRNYSLTWRETFVSCS